MIRALRRYWDWLCGGKSSSDVGREPIVWDGRLYRQETDAEARARLNEGVDYLPETAVSDQLLTALLRVLEAAGPFADKASPGPSIQDFADLREAVEKARHFTKGLPQEESDG